MNNDTPLFQDKQISVSSRLLWLLHETEDIVDKAHRKTPGTCAALKDTIQKAMLSVRAIAISAERHLEEKDTTHGMDPNTKKQEQDILDLINQLTSKLQSLSAEIDDKDTRTMLNSSASSAASSLKQILKNTAKQINKQNLEKSHLDISEYPDTDDNDSIEWGTA